MSNPAATQADFERMSPEAQEGVLAVLETCKKHRLSVRCESVGRDMSVVIGRGYSSPAYWVDYFNNQQKTQSKT